MIHANTTRLAALAGTLFCAALSAQPPAEPRKPIESSKPAPSAIREEGTTLNFDKDQAGKLPPGWKVGQSPSKADPAADPAGDPAKEPGKPTDPGKSVLKALWTVSPDPTAPTSPNTLELIGSSQGLNGYNICICEKHSHKDVDLTAKLHGNTGKIEQGGGIAWRVRNAENFYACAYNPADGKFKVFKVIDGRTQELGSADFKGSGPDASTWYTVSARMTGDTISCSINGQELLHTSDSALKDSGHIALWARGDAATSFDDVMIKGASESKKDIKEGIPPRDPPKGSPPKGG